MPRLNSLPILMLALAAAGCKDDDGIRAYTVPRLRQPPPRVLAAMIPNGDKVWFVKMAGPEPAVAAEKAAFEPFVTSLRFTDQKDAPLKWTLPGGWRESHDKKPGRTATFRAGPESVEVSVSSLGSEANDVKRNVDRWRGQIGLKPVAGDAELESLCKKITVDGHPATLVDMTGVSGDEAAPSPREFSPNAPAARDSKSSPPSPPTSGAPITYMTPSGWTEIPAKSMRVAAFRVGTGDQSAEITVIPLSGPAGGLLANVNRWRKEIGLEDLTDAQLGKESKTLDVDGQNAVYVDLLGKEKRNLGVILPRGGRTWFIKFQGPIALVEKERANFEAFARSVRFAAGGGS